MLDLPQITNNEIIRLHSSEPFGDFDFIDAEFSGDGRIVCSEINSALILWDVSTGKIETQFSIAACLEMLRPYDRGIHVKRLALNSNGSRVLLGFTNGETILINTENRAHVHIFNSPFDPSDEDNSFQHGVHALTFSSDGAMMAMAYAHRYVEIRRIEDGNLVAAFDPGDVQVDPSVLYTRLPCTIAFSRDDGFLFLFSSNRLPSIINRVADFWDISTGELMYSTAFGRKNPTLNLPSTPLSEYGRFTPNNLLHGPGGPYVSGEFMGSHPVPSLDLSRDRRLAVIPHTDTSRLQADSAILFKIDQEQQQPIAVLPFNGELRAQRFTSNSILQLNMQGEIYRSELPTDVWS